MVAYPVPSKDVATIEEHMRLHRGMGSPAAVFDDTFNISGTALKVVANGTTNVAVSASKEGSIFGVHYPTPGSTVTLAVPTNAGSATLRRDLVVLRLTFNGDSTDIAPAYKTGGATEPTLTHNFTTAYEIPLAAVSVPAGSAVVPPGNVADRRSWVAPQPIIGNGIYRPPALPGQLLVEPNAVLVGNVNPALSLTSWKQVWPIEQAAYTAIQPPGSGTGRFKTGWRNYNDAAGDGGVANSAYHFGPGDLVTFQGAVQCTSPKAAHSTIFTLPANVRPTSKRVFDQRGGTIDVFANGDVQTGLGLDDNGYIFLDGINFRTPI